MPLQNAFGNLATETKQDTQITTLGTINTNIADIETNIGAQADASASTDTGTFSLIALFKRMLTKLPVLGQSTMANSQPVVIASDQSTLPILPVAALNTTYTQAGVIAINTVLMTLDCSRYRSVSVQCTSMGTSGVVTPEWSNDNATWVTATIVTQAGATATTFNAAGLWNVPVQARYLRLRLSTATTAGTTTLNVHQWDDSRQFWLATQPVSGTVTANIGTGSLAAGTNAIGDVGVQYRANNTGAASRNHLISAATANPTIVKASAGRLLGWNISNTNAAFRYVKFHNQTTSPTAGTGVVQTIAVPPNSNVNFSMEGGIAFTTGIGMTTVTGAADNDSAAVGANDLIIDVFFA